jgi:hypothetical protein
MKHCRLVTSGTFRVGDRSRGRFATPAEFPRQGRSPYEDYTYTARVWDLSIVQGPFSVAPCQTLELRFATLFIAVPHAWADP